MEASRLRLLPGSLSFVEAEWIPICSRPSRFEQLVGDVEHGTKALKRSLSAVDLTLLGIGAIIGTGIFVLTGTAAANQAGPAIVLSYVAAGIACGFAALCYAEFASMIPIAGSAYTYAYATLGEVFAWMIGWDLILEYAVGSMTVAIGWSGYMQRLLHGFGIDLPVWAPGGHGVGAGERHQPAGGPDRASDHDAPGHRRAGVGEGQCRSGDRQGRRRAVLPARRLHLREHRQLGAVFAVWVAGCDGRRGRRLLRLHRVRRGLDDRRGSQESETGSSDWHHRVSGHLHGPLSGRRGRPHRHHSRDALSVE